MASLNVCDNYIHNQQREIVPAEFRITTVTRLEVSGSVDLCHQHFRAELAGLADGGMLPDTTYSLQRLG
jgi:hypothetical protein